VARATSEIQLIFHLLARKEGGQEVMRAKEKTDAEIGGKGRRGFSLIRRKGYARKRLRFSPQRKVLYGKRR
jgi:hypothetical protein